MQLSPYTYDLLATLYYNNLHSWHEFYRVWKLTWLPILHVSRLNDFNPWSQWNPLFTVPKLLIIRRPNDNIPVDIHIEVRSISSDVCSTSQFTARIQLPRSLASKLAWKDYLKHLWHFPHHFQLSPFHIRPPSDASTTFEQNHNAIIPTITATWSSQNGKNWRNNDNYGYCMLSTKRKHDGLRRQNKE